MYNEIKIDEIETHQLCRDSLDLKDNNIVKNNVSHSSFTNIYNFLFNNTKNDFQLSTTIIGLLLKLNKIINSNDDKNLIFDNLSQRVDNYKNYLLI